MFSILLKSIEFPVRSAPDRLALVSSSVCIFMPLRSDLDKLTSVRSANARLAPVRFDSLMFALIRYPLVKSEPLKSEPRRLVPYISQRESWLLDRLLLPRSAQLKRAAIRIELLSLIPLMRAFMSEAPNIRAPVISASHRSTEFISALVRSASKRLHPLMVAPDRRDSDRDAWLRSAPVRSAPVRLTLFMIAPFSMA